jgi:hypothetical protein
MVSVIVEADPVIPFVLSEPQADAHSPLVTAVHDMSDLVTVGSVVE